MIDFFLISSLRSCLPAVLWVIIQLQWRSIKSLNLVSWRHKTVESEISRKLNFNTWLNHLKNVPTHQASNISVPNKSIKITFISSAVTKYIQLKIRTKIVNRTTMTKIRHLTILMRIWFQLLRFYIFNSYWTCESCYKWDEHWSAFHFNIVFLHTNRVCPWILNWMCN